MTKAGVLLRQRWPEAARWTACFAFVACAHAGAAVALMTKWDSNDILANAPAITLDLAPIAAAPEEVPQEVAVGPQQIETPPEEEPPPPQSDVQMEQPKPPPPKPPEKKKVAKLTTAPAPARVRAPVAAAPAPGASGSNAVPNWKSELVSRLERNKRYPSGASGAQGVVVLAFTVDRSGGVHGARVTRSSGSSALDAEAVSLAQRVSPVPAPPAEMGGSIPIVVPIRFSAR